MLQLVRWCFIVTNILSLKHGQASLENKRFVQSLLGMKHSHNLSFSELNHLRLLQFMKIPSNTIKHTIVPELKIIGSIRNKSRFDEQFECIALHNEDCYKMVVMFRNNQYIEDKLIEYPLSIRFNEETNRFVLDLSKWGSIHNDGSLVVGIHNTDIDWTQIPKLFTRIQCYAQFVDLRNMDPDCNIYEINFYYLRRIHIGTLPSKLKSIGLWTGCNRAKFIGDYSDQGGLQNLWANGQYLEFVTLSGYYPNMRDPKWLQGFRNMKNLKRMDCLGFGHPDDLIPIFLNENPKKTAESAKDAFTAVIGLRYYIVINKNGLRKFGLL